MKPGEALGIWPRVGRLAIREADARHSVGLLADGVAGRLRVAVSDPDGKTVSGAGVT